MAIEELQSIYDHYHYKASKRIANEYKIESSVFPICQRTYSFVLAKSLFIR